MIGVTEHAKAELKNILSATTDNPQIALRLGAKSPNGFALGTDVEVPGDQVVEYGGSKVLLLEHELAARLNEHTLAFEDKEFVIVKGPLSGFNKSVVTLDVGKTKQ
jgi:Fe-S cluster assembly iron-binding protein IscA